MDNNLLSLFILNNILNYEGLAVNKDTSFNDMILKLLDKIINLLEGGVNK